MTNQENKPDMVKTLATPFIIKLIYGAATSITILIGSIVYSLYPEFFFKYLVFFLFNFSIGLFSFFLPARSGFIYKYNKIEKSKNTKTVESIGKFTGKKFLKFLPGAEKFITDIVTIFIQNPGILVPVLMPTILGIVALFNVIVDSFSDYFVKL